MYWFNRTTQDFFLEESWHGLSALKFNLARTPLEDIVNLLDGFGKNFQPDAAAVARLMKETGFSEAEVEMTLGLLPGLLSRESLLKRVRSEFGTETVLDRFSKIKNFQGEVKASPAGILLHITAGNVFLSSIDSLITGFLTKNLSILKVSSRNTFFPEYFAKSLASFDEKSILADKFAILNWKGGDKSVEHFIKKKVNTIIAWGGEEVMASYRENLPPGVKFLDFGPKISIQVISRKGLQNKNLQMVADKIVADIIPWDQAACSSPQNLYLEEGIGSQSLIAALSSSFESAKARGEISEDEATEILKEYYRGLYSELMEEGEVVLGANYLLHQEKNSFLRPSSLNRSLILKTYKKAQDLYEHLEPFSYYLQSCSYLVSPEEKNEYLELLALTGIKRFAPLGTITWGMDGAPHDGRFVLRELVNFIGDEKRAVNYGEEIMQVENSATLKMFFDQAIHPEGYIFSSGGTTGEPKYVHFSYEEFDSTTDLLAENLRAQGIVRGMTVANLFVAGNLWSSFMAMEKALEKIGAIQLPIGGLCAQENILQYLKKFNPQVVMGIPSLLVSLAEFAESRHEKLVVETVFYAGEALSSMRQNYIEKVWKTKNFGSAGYASVDAGVIGYQCRDCGPGEHHVFSDLIDLKIIEEEAVVTSLIRSTMPVKNYRTGDKIEWIPDCKCGRSDRRFKLLGRIDNVIQVWSCRILLSDIEAAFKEIAPKVRTFQVVLSDLREHNLPKERMTIVYEGEGIMAIDLLEVIYDLSRDLRDTITYGEFLEDVVVEQRELGGIERNARTGKISIIKDLRR
jgi:phenylacetate-CoA ligase